MAYGGRVAEELIFGPDKVTTGAAQDIQHATELARRMVTEFGMSDAVGPVAIGEKEQQVFLGREFAQHREVSEKTAEMVDTEIKRILDDAYQRAREILTTNMDKLHAMTEALLERETLDRDQVSLIGEGKSLPPRAATPAPPAAPQLPKTRAEEGPSGAGPVLGTPGAEPAGA